MKFKINRLPLTCQIIIDQGVLPGIPSLVDLSNYSQFIIVADKQLNHPANQLIKGLQKTKKPVCLIKQPAGEINKTEKQANIILSKILNLKPVIDRKILILALAGGVIGDLTGYVAAKILRGVDYFQIPTTFMAMVDSSLGGKTAVDHLGITNMIGFFHLPKTVIMDVNLLKTLPNEQWRAGLAELIKHALLEPKLFSLINQTNFEALKTNPLLLIKVLKLSAQYKMGVVSEDFEEKTGQRKLLNFGHTVGRALEAASDFKLNHGQAVSLGMTAALKISQQKKLLSQNEFTKTLNLIKKYHLPMKTKKINLKKFWQALSLDKKSMSGQPRFILLCRIGQPKINCQVNKKIINQVLKEIIR
jgi:3-dehydroquinate synthase